MAVHAVGTSSTLRLPAMHLRSPVQDGVVRLVNRAVTSNINVVLLNAFSPIKFQ